MNSVAHWQVLIALVVLLIRDASMFEDTEYEIVGLVLIATNLLMLCMLLIPVGECQCWCYELGRQCQPHSLDRINLDLTIATILPRPLQCLSSGLRSTRS